MFKWSLFETHRLFFWCHSLLHGFAHNQSSGKITWKVMLPLHQKQFIIFNFFHAHNLTKDMKNRDHDVHPESRSVESQITNTPFFQLAWTTGGRQFIWRISVFYIISSVFFLALLLGTQEKYRQKAVSDVLASAIKIIKTRRGNSQWKINVPVL